ncbi:MAG: response regulator transcription factor [Actinomycetota bacterium]
MTAPVILVVDDDASMRSFVRRNLEARDYEVEECANGMEALATLRHATIDLVVLDIMMPHLDGYETCRRLRAFTDVPVIVLTAMADERDIVAALDCGADDCLTKPFGVEELLARVRSALRRANVDSAADTGDRITYRELSVDVGANRVWLGDEELDLTRTELSVLRFYAQHLGKTVPHQQILQAVWGDGYERETHYVRIYLSRLRTKIETPGEEPYFVTEHGLGYRLG